MISMCGITDFGVHWAMSVKALKERAKEMTKGYAHHEREAKDRKRVGKRLLTIMDKLYSLEEKEWQNIDKQDSAVLDEIYKKLEAIETRYR
jgi:hypothetical protein